ncbi:MAG: hypothetical protein ACOYL4_06735 [Miltoncostaeaceae bacterium]
MSDTPTDAEAPVEEAAVVTEEAAVATEEAAEVTEEAAVVTEEVAEVTEEAAAVVDEIVEEGTPAEEYEPEDAAGPSGPRAREGLATLYLCERGHRTLAIWSEAPSTCHARPTRSGPECGRQVYHSTELPEQVQKALNPIKASKKSSKG